MVTLAEGRQGIIDEALDEKGLKRRVQLKIPYFASAAWTIEHSDMVLTVPKRLAKRLAKIARIRMIEPPIELAEFRYIQVSASPHGQRPRPPMAAAHVRRTAVAD